MVSAISYRKQLFEDYSLISQAGALESIGSGLVNYLKSKMIPGHPIASVLGLVTPRLLFSFNPWFGVGAYVAEFFGFNFGTFWEVIGNLLDGLFNSITSGSEKLTPQDVTEKVSQSVDKASQISIATSGSDEISDDEKNKLKQYLAQKALIQKNQNLVNDFLQIKKTSSINKQAFSLTKSTIFKKILSVFRWVLVTLFTSLLAETGVGLAKSVKDYYTGNNENQNNIEKPQQSNQPESLYVSDTSNIANQNVKPDTSNYDVIEVHNNTLASPWLEQGSIDDINNIILNWVISSYPSLKNYSFDIEQSQSFNKIVSLFKQRNTYAEGLNIFTVPRPFQRKLDIASAIVNDFLAKNPINSKKKDLSV